MPRSTAREKFYEVAATSHKIRLIKGEEDAVRSIPPHVALHNEMHDWAKSRRTSTVYLPLLERRVVVYENLEEQFLDDHARLTYYRGIKKALSLMIEEIRNWTGDTPADTGTPLAGE